MNGTVSEVFTVEILSFVPDSVSFVTDDRNSNFFEICFLSLVGLNSRLEAFCHLTVAFILTSVSNVKSWSQRIDIKEGVFSMIDLGYWGFVQRLVTSITNSW